MKRIVYIVLTSLLLFMSVPEAASASSADKVINIGKKYMGTKYRYGGTTPAGFDCSGYTQYVFREAGVSIPRTTGTQFRTGHSVAKSSLKTGDLVFFNTSGRGVSHVGIYIKGGSFIHASTSRGVMISPLNDPYYWGSRYVGARRVKNFDEQPKVAAPQPKPVVKEEPTPTRGEVAKILANELNLTATAEANFSDVPASHPYAKEIAAVVEAGIFSGNEVGKFNPNNKITRKQAAKVIAIAFELEQKSNVQFADMPYDEYVDLLATNNITTGVKQADGSLHFNPNQTLSEKHFLTFVERAKAVQ